MPSVIPVHVALRSRLRDSACQALTLAGRLEPLLAEKSRGPEERFHGKVDHSQPPWNAQIANAILDLHQLAREAEAWLRLSQGLPLRERGGSAANTRRALEAVVRLSEKAEDITVRGHIRDLEKWIRGARTALGETEAPKRLPRSEGQPEPRCPFCEQHTLRMQPLRGRIFCISPGCRDDQERKPYAILEYSPHVGDMVLVWQDGISGVPAA
jgi:hypothetical protein